MDVHAVLHPAGGLGLDSGHVVLRPRGDRERPVLRFAQDDDAGIPRHLQKGRFSFPFIIIMKLSEVCVKGAQIRQQTDQFDIQFC